MNILSSAYWCPPCKGFTPILTKFYNNYHEAKNFEIIFVSSDRNENEFNEYYSKMPWLALEYCDRDKNVSKLHKDD